MCIYKFTNIYIYKIIKHYLTKKNLNYTWTFKKLKLTAINGNKSYFFINFGTYLLSRVYQVIVNFQAYTKHLSGMIFFH